MQELAQLQVGRGLGQFASSDGMHCLLKDDGCYGAKRLVVQGLCLLEA